jgi:hypothetical protein
MITVNSNRAYITFVSNGSLEYDGFLISYKAVRSFLCSGLVTYSAAAHTFDDGSGSKHYNKRQLNVHGLSNPLPLPWCTLSFDYIDLSPIKTSSGYVIITHSSSWGLFGFPKLTRHPGTRSGLPRMGRQPRSNRQWLGKITYTLHVQV